MTDQARAFRRTAEVVPGTEEYTDRNGKTYTVRQATTAHGTPKRVVYGPENTASLDYDRDLGDPGEYPFTRGLFPTGYRSRLWTFRQYSGLGTAADTNARYKYLLSLGQTGLSVAFDLPTQTGLDADDPRAYGEVGRIGVAVSSLADMEDIFDGIPLDKISTSFTINAPSNYVLCMYLVVAEKQGVPWSEVRGTLQNDILKEYVSRGTWIYPPEPSIRMTGDTIEFCLKHVPRMNPVNVCQGHMYESGANEVYAMALTNLNAEVYIQEMLRRGYHVDDFAPLFTFIGSSDIKLFEGIARYRAWRRLWARRMKEKYGAKNPKSMMLRIANGAGAPTTLTRREPLNNLARLTFWMLMAALGGTQSMTICGYDEAYATPTEESAKLSLRIQQIVAYETGIADVVDPLAGSYYVETLTNEIEAKTLEYMNEIEAAGGMVAGIESARIQREIARQAYEKEKEINRGERVMVGVNKFRDPNEQEPDFPIYRPDSSIHERQIERLNKVRRERDNVALERSLRALREVATRGENVIPPMMECVRAYATVGEVHGLLREVYGEFKEPAIL
ncbi:MAG: methylmalonyl-CoA mutase [Chloroflexota bacterium]|nr:MAG: methylmalonyl-CoA mutase [Chloroflexota bacterium]